MLIQLQQLYLFLFCLLTFKQCRFKLSMKIVMGSIIPRANLIFTNHLGEYYENKIKCIFQLEDK